MLQMKVTLALFVCFIAIAWAQDGPLTDYPDCINGPLAKFPICDASLTVQARVQDIISRLNVTEKVIRIGQSYGLNALPRVGLPPYHWRQNAVHGLGPGVIWTKEGEMWSNCTVFPHVINIGATFDRMTFSRMGQMIATEARAFANVGRAGLDWFTPNINIYRDPRWGRGQETPGEDPLLTSVFGVQFVRGLQEGEDSRYYKTVGDCKHYAGYDLEDWGGNNRVSYNAIISDLDLVETYIYPFKSCVQEAQVGSIMCSYNAVNGVPSCANPFFLQTILRDSYGFDGFVVSDCGAVGLVYTAHHYYNTTSATVQGVLRSGVDQDCGPFYAQYGVQAYNDGSINDMDLDLALTRTFTSLVKMGYFDDPKLQPYRQIGPEMVNAPAHQEAALFAAIDSIVLLKNDGTLPFKQQKTNIALIGPNANAQEALLGNYQAPTPYIISVMAGIVNLGYTVTYAEGCTIAGNSTSGFDAALKAAQSADFTVFVGGIDNSIEAEGHDRSLISLPGVQLQLIQALEKVSKSPITIVMIGGGQVDVSYSRDSKLTGAILWAGYPGQSGGAAVARVLFGYNSPAGRLPVTSYPADYVNQVPMTDQSFRSSKGNPGRTYRFYTGTPVYSFGDGLSYTTFAYTYPSNLNLPSSLAIDDVLSSSNRNVNDQVIHYRVNVTNTGNVISDDVVLGYVSSNSSMNIWSQTAPIKSLFDFTRVRALGVGHTVEVFFALNLKSLISYDKHGDSWLLPGEYTVFFHNDARLKHVFVLTGIPTIVESFPRDERKSKTAAF